MHREGESASMLTDEERVLFDAVALPIIVSDPSGHMEYVNVATAALLGWDPAQLVGKPLTVLMPERMHAQHTAGIARYTRTHESKLLGRPVRVPALRRDGEEIEIDLTLRLFRRPDGSDLILGNMTRADEASHPEGLIELESKLQRRAYQLV